MQFLSVQESLVLLAALAGAAHVLAPDHWMPASVLAWQRRWGLLKVVSFSTLAFLLHVATGFLIFVGGISFFRNVPPQDLVLFSLILIIGVTAVRALRFSRVSEIQRTAPRNFWAVLGVFSLLGPCESIIPVFIKADQLGIGYVLPFVAFLAGTLIAGTLATLFGRFAWNRPFWLPRGLELAHQKMSAVPMVFLVAVGISLIARISG